MESNAFSHHDTLELATATFTCEEAPCVDGNRVLYLFGWDDIASHHCRPDSFSDHPHWYHQPVEHAPTSPKIVFSTRGSKAAGTTIRAAGLDDRVATVSNMDAKDLRFACLACPAKMKHLEGAPTWTKVGYRWRDFVGSCFQGLFFTSNMIASRCYIALTICTPQRTSSLCFL